MNFENYFSPLQYLYIGYYVHGMISIDELAKNYLSLPTDVVKNIISEIKLKSRLKGDDFEVGQALKDFAIRVEKQVKTK